MDINHSTPCNSWNCESLANFSFDVDIISSSSPASWYIGQGYSGNGFALTESAYGGHIEFALNTSMISKITFWTKSINPGFQNRTPTVTVDGRLINTSLINGSEEYTNWMQLETEEIAKGNHTIRIDFTYIFTYYDYFVDEIQVWCKNES
jgi:hypothetical protein